MSGDYLLQNQNKKPAFFDLLASEVRSIFGEGLVHLHRPVFSQTEKNYLVECIDSNFVSSVGKRVDEFEAKIAEYTGSRFAIATVNGTSALHIALILAGVERGDEVITQALSFIATANAISYIGAKPVFLDVEQNNLGLSPKALRKWLEENSIIVDGKRVNRKTNARISAIVPMHTLGFPCSIEEIAQICEEFGIPLVEDAAESLGSFVKKRHTGTFGMFSTLSFNGNKIITTGGGGMILTQDPLLAKRAKHITTTAKKPHPWAFEHDEIGYNYRMPNLNAAVGVAQIEKLDVILQIKREVVQRYVKFLEKSGYEAVVAEEGTSPNYWLNAFFASSLAERNAILDFGVASQIMMRPLWQLLPTLSIYQHCECDDLINARFCEERIICLPSSVPDSEIKRVLQ